MVPDMDEVILYSTGCPKCKELKMYLKLAGIKNYREVNDVNAILSDGFSEVPALSVNGEKMETKDAFEWCKSLINNHRIVEA